MVGVRGIARSECHACTAHGLETASCDARDIPGSYSSGIATRRTSQSCSPPARSGLGVGFEAKFYGLGLVVGTYDLGVEGQGLGLGLQFRAVLTIIGIHLKVNKLIIVIVIN